MCDESRTHGDNGGGWENTVRLCVLSLPTGVHGNFASLKQFFYSAMGILKNWLNWRSQGGSDTWEGYQELLGVEP